MNKDIPAEVYNNLYALTKWRNIRADTPYDLGEFKKNMAARDYVVITGKRDVEINGVFTPTNVVIVLFNEDSVKGSKTADFKKVLVDVAKTISDDNCEIMTVTPQPLNTHLKKALDAFMRDHPWYVEAHSYSKFIIEFPLHEIMDKHEIVPHDELEKLLFVLKTDKSKFPKIHAYDTGVVWIGARPGQVVRIHRSSETAGIAIAYRLVK